jgi:hypothetical protein
MKKKLVLGDSCFITLNVNQKDYSVRAKIVDVNTEVFTVYVEKVYDRDFDHVWGTVWAIKPDRCAPLAEDLFCVGQGVRSLIGTSSFVVSGFEEHLNRVVVIPASNDDRRRYSYAIKELGNAIKPDLKLVIGNKYKINQSLEVMACEAPLKHLSIFLVALTGPNKGKTQYSVRHTDGAVAQNTFTELGITNIQEMK